MSYIPFGGDSFTMHRRSSWELLSADESNPRWLRVACLAYARCRANGHASFGRSILSMTLSDRDLVTGDPVIPTRQTVYEAVQSAVSKGWLSEGSSSRCLIVPRHVLFGVGGSKAQNATCPWCDNRAARRRKAS